MITTRTLRTIMWTITGGLCALGLVMVASTTTASGSQGFVIRQAAAIGIGLVAAIVISRVGTAPLRQTAVVIGFAVTCLGLLLIARTFMRPVNGAWRWIDLGPISIQPVELAKLALIATTAWYLVRLEERVRVNWYGVLLPLIGFAVLAILVYRTRDLGSVVVLAGILWIMLFYAGANWLYSLVLGIACLPMVLYLAVLQTAYRRERILAFLNPLDPDNAAAYHLRQAHIAISEGGVSGVGLGQGMSKHAYLPENHTDFIYAVICEELGMVGGVVVAAAFLLLTWVGFTLAGRNRDRHRRLLAVGVTVLIAIQAFWNMLVVVGVLPTKGLTLPFISYGGSSMVACLLAVGLLDAVARTASDPEPLRAMRTTRIGAVMVGADSQRRSRRLRPARRREHSGELV